MITLPKNVDATWLVFLFFLMFRPLSSGIAQPVEPQTVASVDLARFTGLWYEIARIPNRFQKKSAQGTTAEYLLREDGRITVSNRCATASRR